MASVKLAPILALSLLLSACGVEQLLVLREGKVEGGITVPGSGNTDPEKPNSEKIFLEGSVPQIDGTVVDFKSLQDKPLVLMFAGFLCSSCAEEAKEVRAALQDPNSPPDNVQLLSVVVGEDQSTAEWWKGMREVTWDVGYDENLELFTKYCGASATPCTLIQTPQDGIVYKHVGKTPVSKMQELTGTWETK